jgi:predicted transcriptional regulator YdeE
MKTAFNPKIITKPQFQAIGLVWEGTFAEAGAGGIRNIISQMHERLREIQHVVNPDILLGLSYHITPGGFTHYSVVEVEHTEHIPEGMKALTVPTLTYAKCEHARGQNVDQSYKNIFDWIEHQGYDLYKEDMTHFEEYPMQQDPYDKDPEFRIMIPIVVK